MLKADETSGTILFEEKQNFPKWLNILLAVIVLWTLAVILISGFAGPAEKRNEMWMALAMAMPIELLLIILFKYMELEKVVTSNGFYYRWKPWQRKYRCIEKEMIETFAIRRFPFMSYGMGWIPGYGRYHNASSGAGLQLYLKNGKRFYFSTANIDTLNKTMDRLINPSQNQVG